MVYVEWPAMISGLARLPANLTYLNQLTNALLPISAKHIGHSGHFPLTEAFCALSFPNNKALQVDRIFFASIVVVASFRSRLPEETECDSSSIRDQGDVPAQWLRLASCLSTSDFLGPSFSNLLNQPLRR
jgi:hypothetical protein